MIGRFGGENLVAVRVEALLRIGFAAEIDDDRLAVEIDPEAAGVVVAVALAIVGRDAGEERTFGLFSCICAAINFVWGSQTSLRRGEGRGSSARRAASPKIA